MFSRSSTSLAFGWALAGSVAIHAAALGWAAVEFTPRSEQPASATVIKVMLAAAQIEPVVAEKPVTREPRLRPVPRPERVVPQPTPRGGPVLEPMVSQPLVAQSAVENQAPRIPVPAPEAPIQVAAVPKARAREPDYLARYLYNPPPQYPWQARRMGIEGRVVLQVEILQNGNAGRIEIRQSSGHELLDQAAIKAVGGWRFEAARIAGAPITAWADVPISFKLTDR